MSRIIGIDLGTTNSLACYWKDGQAELIPNVYGEYLTPSVVSFDDDGTTYIGKLAKERLITHPDTTFETFKRSMGTDRKYGNYTAVELSAIILSGLKKDAEAYLNETIEEAVISVPAYFDDKARKATKNAGMLAGLKVERIINEPSAAALGYLKGQKLLQTDNENDENSDTTDDSFDDHSLLIFDFGGGTLDVSIVDTFDSVVEIISVSGDNRLGGTDFDKAIAKHYITEKNLNESELTPFEYNCILESAEKVKRELSDNQKATMYVNAPGISGSLEISNKELLQITTDLFKKIYKVLENVFRDSNRPSESLTDIVMVGGSSKMPIVKHCVESFLNRHDITIGDPDRMIAIGMGVYAGIKERNIMVKDVVLTDVCPFSLGTSVVNHFIQSSRGLTSFIIPRNTALPTSKTEIYATAYPNQISVVFEILQGEEMYSDMNKKIGEIKIDFPEKAEQGTKAIVTYSYDLNGILVVDIEIPKFNIKRNSVIIDNNLGLSEKEIDEKIRQLNNIKTLNREDEEDRQLMEWGERLFVQAPDYIREDLKLRILQYQNLSNGKGDYYQKPRIREYMKNYLLNIELTLFKRESVLLKNDDTWMSTEDREIEKMLLDWDEDKDL